MTLGAGSRVGAYEVLGPIGAGGMGEVYRAHDTRLGRDVAIKVLPAAFLDDSDRRSRFEREARAIAAISHPNIVSVFDTGLHDGQLFIVMELLRGETLRERLAGGALPVRKAIDVAMQLARGLATAHAAGIVHRDLKPENIILLPDGLVKILDFGLARQIATPESSATVTAATDPGSVLGSAGYMAPEQVRGEPADARTDIFALGVVLYELLTGRRAFARDTPVEAMTAVLREELPDLTALRTDLPAGLARGVRHCLEKRPEDRFQSASDLAFSLSALSEIPAKPPPHAPIRRHSWRGVAIAVVLAAAILAAALVLVRWLRPDEALVTFQTVTHRLEWITRARFGPDGRTIVFSAAPTGNVPELYVLPPDRTVPQSLGRATHLLAVSSTGELAVLTHARYLHFFLFEGTLARMTLDGAPRPWLEHVREADWAPDGSTLAIVHALETEDRLEYPIGTVLYRTQGYISDPRVSPDGSRVAFLDHQLRYDNRGWVKVVDAHGTVSTLAGEFSGEESPVWSPDGRRLYFAATERGGEPYQPMVVNVDGTPRPRLAYASPGPMVVEDINAEGRQLVIRHDDRWGLRVRQGSDSVERDASWLDFVSDGALLRDRHALLFTDESTTAGANYATELRNLETGAVVRLGEGRSLGPSPDGRWALSEIPSTGEVVAYPTGPGQPVRVSRAPLEHYTSQPAWFPNASRLVVCGNEPELPPRCYEQDPAGGTPTPITPPGTTAALVAQDGRKVLAQTASGAWEIASIGRDDASPAPGLTAADEPIAWSTDERSVVVSRPGDMPIHVERVDLTSGARTVVRDLSPPERSGVIGGTLDDWSDRDGAYAYMYQRSLSTLFLVSGAR